MKLTGLKLSDMPTSADCPQCGAPTRLFGIEPHPTLDRTDLHTYVCARCDCVQVKVVPLVTVALVRQ